MTVAPGRPDGDGRHARRRGGIAEAWLRRSAAVVRERRRWLTELDAAIGDGDHGINLDRGLTAIVADLDSRPPDPRDPAALLVASGRRVLGLVGGASGALYGRALIRAGERLETSSDGGSDMLLAFEAAVDSIVSLGGARAGDKTMLDALLPALEALRAAPAGEAPGTTLRRVADAAASGARATIPLVARKGRASYLGERSAGHLDPGAASTALLLRCLADVAREPDAAVFPAEPGQLGRTP